VVCEEERVDANYVSDPVESRGNRRSRNSWSLDQFRVFRGRYQVDYGAPHKIKTGHFLIELFEEFFFQLSFSEGGAQEVGHAKARLFNFIEKVLKEKLREDPEVSNLSLKLTTEDVQKLLQLDPDRINRGGWIDLKEEASASKVFISCGQQTNAEKELGNSIASLIAAAGLNPYFAENQTSMEGVTSNIFDALFNAFAFVAVMHKRDSLAEKEYRGSVWIEQEIALASFITQSLGRTIPAKLYVEKGIKREGVRGYIILKAIEFETVEEVLEDLAIWLKHFGGQHHQPFDRKGTGARAVTTYPGVVELIEGSDAKREWKRTETQNQSMAIYLPDINLRIETFYDDRGKHSSNFQESWATKFPDSKATSNYYDIYYGSSLLDKMVLVSVDGGRALLPLPENRDNLQVNKLGYKIAQIFPPPKLLMSILEGQV
jgi:hypothetical protein